MAAKPRTVQEYIEELDRSKKEKPDQVKEALEIYLDLWKSALKKGVVSPTDSISDALTKIEAKGGLYESAGG
ncbi:MAG TPA: hypothetical protein VLY21_04395 [Nitrososphaerales archaeon]|nr:hypothetical protein [Nitrososphaerales archaeon]